ncbi:hypothetical protein [Leptothoe spongobia]|uniref:Killing trait domain-containing protein n=1 Tax=Leptothoe spongobia TAU-MAC 1115 TaxID=1967444 RepID=A0A947GJ11_9CYAN|nr:hypothetical protein [Leptothoe spongobia]MBT9316630.1 hypothetical protein [Leptothoe spongobia TAU-MAC 1115]
MDPTTVNPQIIDSVNQTQLATMSPQVVKTSGAGKAYQSVAQSAAIAIQDATDNLRNASTIATTAAGVAISQMLVDPANAELYQTVIQESKDLVTQSTTDLAAIGTAMATLMKEFPSG